MSKMTAETLMQVYPPVLEKDQLFNALGQATAEILGEAFLNTKHASIYTRVMDLSEGVLDILAKDFAIAWYDYNYPLETKRRVIAAAFSVYYNNGTKAALETALRAVYPDARVEEWFEYGGEPFYFRVVLNEPDIDFDEVKKMIELYKNERSHLHDITYSADEVEVPFYVGSADSETLIQAESLMFD